MRAPAPGAGAGAGAPSPPAAPPGGHPGAPSPRPRSTVRDVFGGAAELCASELGGMGVSEGDFAAYVAAVARQCGGPGES